MTIIFESGNCTGISTLFMIALFLLAPQLSGATDWTSVQPGCRTQSDDPNLFVKDFAGEPTKLRNNTPYAIKNAATHHVFVHRTKAIQLLKLSHWWELVFETSPNIYKLRSMDSNLHNKLPRLVRTVQIRQTGVNTYSLHPTSCSGSNTKVGTSPSWIYFDFIDENGNDQIKCEPFKESKLTTTRIEAKYEYTFTPLSQHLSSNDWILNETIIAIGNDPDQLALNFARSPNAKSKVLRAATINNCGSGKVEQEVEFTTEVTAMSRLHVEKSFGVATNLVEQTRIGGGIGWKIHGVFDFGIGVKKSWSQETFEGIQGQNKDTFVQEQVIEIGTKEKIRVGNHSCVKIEAKTALLENFPLAVLVQVQLAILGNSTGTLDREENAEKFLQLMKLSGKEFVYNASTRSVTFSKRGTVELTSLVSMETNIQQVVCNCSQTN